MRYDTPRIMREIQEKEACPSCGAKAGSPCVRTSRTIPVTIRYLKDSHQRRYDLFWIDHRIEDYVLEAKSG